jgi:hypothetical protein
VAKTIDDWNAAASQFNEALLAAQSTNAAVGTALAQVDAARENLTAAQTKNGDAYELAKQKGAVLQGVIAELLDLPSV